MIITLLTDFGVADHYVAAMKGVIAGIAPEARVIDVTHEVSPFNVVQGAFLLYQAVPWFPQGTIHVAVVDPRVGSSRAPMAVETRRAILVGPNNGLLMPAARELGFIGARAIHNPKYVLKKSWTFHGRDVFSPVAAYLAMGVPTEELGPPIESPTELELWLPEFQKGRVVGTFLHVDHFGNLITNIPTGRLSDKMLGAKHFTLKLGKRKLSVKAAKSYFEGSRGEILLLPGSGGFVEISMNRGSAASFLVASPGDGFELLVD